MENEAAPAGEEAAPEQAVDEAPPAEPVSISDETDVDMSWGDSSHATRLRRRLVRMIERLSSPLGFREGDESPPSGAKCAAICCAQCDGPIASASDLLPAQIARLESASYPYQLDLLGDEECWVYSATNPNDQRFDVARFGAGACLRVRLHGDASTDHSFFPPHNWRMAECATCNAHVGWAFGSAEDANAPPAFLGLVLTHLRERECFESELRTSAKRATESRKVGHHALARLVAMAAERAGEAGVARIEAIVEAAQAEVANDPAGMQQPLLPEAEDEDEDEEEEDEDADESIAPSSMAVSGDGVEDGEHGGGDGRGGVAVSHDEDEDDEQAHGASDLGDVDGMP